jgi:hypothetical protein
MQILGSTFGVVLHANGSLHFFDWLRQGMLLVSVDEQ